MRNMAFAPPLPRAAVADPGLTRPDWCSGVSRDSSLLRLDRNENTDPKMAELTLRLLREVSADTLSTYPECGPLYRKLADYLGVASDRLLLTAGADGVIRAVFESYINPGDVVVHTNPTFAMYAVYCRMFGARAVTLDYQAAEPEPVLSVASVVETIRNARPKLVCLPNPDSPTGTAFAADAMKTIIEVAGSVGALILIDEAYYPFHDCSVLPWVDRYPHMVVAQTFAKAWGLAGLRIGYGVSHPEVTALLHKILPLYEANGVAIAVMLRLIDHPELMHASVRRLNEGRDAAVAALSALGLRTIHAKGNFFHVAFGQYASRVHEALEPIVIYKKEPGGGCLAGFSRFSAAPLVQLAPVVERIRDVVRRPA